MSDHPLRDLARQIEMLAKDHPAYSQAHRAVQNCSDHLCAIACIYEIQGMVPLPGIEAKITAVAVEMNQDAGTDVVLRKQYVFNWLLNIIQTYKPGADVLAYWRALNGLK